MRMATKGALLALLASLALAAGFEESDLGLDWQKEVDWSDPSFVLKLNQKSVSKTWVVDMDSNKGAVPDAIKQGISGQLNTQFEQVFPMEITVGSVDGARAGLLNVSLAELSDDVLNLFRNTSAEHVIPEGATVDGEPATDAHLGGVHGHDLSWVAYEVRCGASTTADSLTIRGTSSGNAGACQDFSTEFARAALPAYTFLMGVICEEASPMQVVKSECSAWRKTAEGDYEGTNCVESGLNKLKEGNQTLTEANGITFNIQDVDPSSTIFVRSEAGNSTVDTSSRMDRKIQAALPMGIELNIQAMNQYDSIVEFMGMDVVDAATSSAAIAICPADG